MEEERMDVADMWRAMRRDPAARPHVGTHVATAEEGISMTVTQECQVALQSADRLPEVTVTITSNRPGVAAQVTIAANLNTGDVSYQGPTKVVGQGQFTATTSTVSAGFVVLPTEFPVLGVGAGALWADGAPESFTLDYYQLACGPWGWWVWWRLPIFDLLRRLFSSSS
jgi:hypothetical protein